MLDAIAYAGLSLLAIIVLSLWPPQSGEMVVYYPFAQSESESVATVFSTDAKLVGKGPIPSSWIVWVEDGAIGDQLTSSGGFLFDANGLHGCSGQQKTKEIMAAQGHSIGDAP